MSSCSRILLSTSPNSQQLHSNIIPRLPLECIAKVIEWIDNRQDLFSLLTVSKDVFLIAARCLYRDPIKNNIHPIDDNTRRLILFLLSLSPATGKDIDIIHQSNGLPPCGTPLYPQPMLDYLSLVKVIHWRGRLYGEDHLCSALRYPNNDICRQLTWSFVGHRLDEVEELEIDVDDQERYLSHAVKMNRLRKIWIHIGKTLNYQSMFDFAEAMIKAIQFHHGLDQLKECHMIPNPLVEGPSGGSLNSGVPDELHDIDLSCTSRVVSLLPPPRQYPTLPRPDGSTVSLNQPFDPYVATVQSIWRPNHPHCDVSWKALMELYPGHSHAQILQRFRGLTSLHIDTEVVNGDDEDLLAWAAYEAEHYHQQYGGHQLRSLVPLERLEVIYDGIELSSTPKLKILHDGQLGFSRTLKKLWVALPLIGDGIADCLFTIPRPLYSLKSLDLLNSNIDRLSWKQVPNIEELYILFYLPWSIFHSATTNQSQGDQNTGMTPLSSMPVDTITTTATTTTTTVTTELQSQLPLPELWFHCPSLTRLTLYDRAINLLDPNCFRLLPRLQWLTLSSSIVTFRKRMSDDGVNSSEARESIAMLHPTRWTWDWSFPVLHTLKLSGDLYELQFSWAILHSCPALKWISLHHDDGSHRYPLRIKGILGASLDKNNHQMLSFTQNNLIGITLSGRWDMEVDELGHLLQVLPALKKLVFGWAKGIGDRELIEVTKSHPSLIQVKTQIRLTLPPSVLGLSKIYGETVESIEKDIPNEYDSKIPTERSCIMYKFKSGKCYALWLWFPHEYDGLNLLFDNTKNA